VSRARFMLVTQECTADQVVIRDVGPWHRHPTVTNDAEAVAAWMLAFGGLRPGMRLFYYDSEGRKDEMIVQNGRFLGFRPGPGHTLGHNVQCLKGRP
jgi:hypothetical protein